MTQATLSSTILSPAVQAFLRRHVNFHRVLWLLIVMSFVIAWNRGLALLYGLFSLLVALLLISHLLPRWQLRGIGVKRKSSSDFTVGQQGSISYHLKAGGTRYHVELGEVIEFADPHEQHHFFGKIPGQATCDIRFTCRQRGCFRLQDILLSCAYPFGVVTASRTAPTESMEVLVFPRVVALTRLPMPLMAATTTWGDVLIPQKGGRDEFTGVREYVHGDGLKNIHWAVSARHQQLVVKEYDKTNRPALLVVLDCFGKFNVGKGPVSTFEFAVTIAASMIRRASREGIQCFLVARDDRLQEITVPAYSSDLYPLYALLARLNCDSRQPYAPVVAHAHKRFPQANLIATFRLSSDTIRQALSPHATQIVLEMEEESFRSPDQRAAAGGFRQEGHQLIYPVHAGQRLETVFR